MDATTTIAVTTAATEATAVIEMIMLLVESIAMLVTTDTAAVVVMTDVEVAEDTLTVMTEEIEAQLAMARQQPPMATQPLVEKAGSHTEVETTMLRDTPVVNINADLHRW